MNQPFLQSALRELTVFGRSRALWQTFVAVVFLFAVTAPYDTGAMRFGPRLGYWTLIHASAWTLAIMSVVIADLALMRTIKSMFLRMLIGSALSAIPIGIANTAIQFLWDGSTMSWFGVAIQMLNALPLCLIFCFISWLSMRGRDLEAKLAAQQYPAPQQAQAAPEKPPAPAENSGTPLMRRLKPENRAPLLHLSVEDHYTVVTTSRGRELILLRFSDALGETGDAIGLRVHRSHWVADIHVAGLVRQGDKLILKLKDDAEIPVSRTYASVVKARYG